METGFRASTKRRLRAAHNREMPSALKMDLIRLRFDDFSALDATGAGANAFDGSVHLDLNPLQVRVEAPERLSQDLGTRPAGTSDLTAPFVFITGDGTFSADFTNTGHKNLTHSESFRF